LDRVKKREKERERGREKGGTRSKRLFRVDQLSLRLVFLTLSLSLSFFLSLFLSFSLSLSRRTRPRIHFDPSVHHVLPLCRSLAKGSVPRVREEGGSEDREDQGEDRWALRGGARAEAAVHHDTRSGLAERWVALSIPTTGLLTASDYRGRSKTDCSSNLSVSIYFLAQFLVLCLFSPVSPLVSKSTLSF